MTDQITLEDALELVEFEHGSSGWRVKNVQGSVGGSVWGDVWGSVWGSVGCSVWGSVGCAIKGQKWEYAETHRERFERLLVETKNEELIEAFKRLEDS